MRILLVNSSKSGLLDRIRKSVPAAVVEVVTEAQYAHFYEPGVPVHVVPNITHLNAVRQAALMSFGGLGTEFVVSPSERSVPTGGYIRSYFGLGGIGFEIANRFTNKSVMKRTLSAAGIPVAPFRVVSGLEHAGAAAEELGWPVVVKPAVGAGGVNTFRFRSRTEMDEFAASAAARGLQGADCPLMVERFVEMDGEYHCDGVVEDGRVQFDAVQRYFLPLLHQGDSLNGSYTLPTDHPDIRLVRELHQATVSALGMRAGVTHMELFKTQDGFLVGEITCRPAGGGIVEGILQKYGIDLWDVFIRMSANEPGVVAGPVSPIHDQIIANCHLPARPGRVRSISSDVDLRGIPGVLDVTMKTSAGDVIGPRLDTASTTGIVQLCAADENQLHERLDRLSTAYVLEVESAS